MEDPAWSSSTDDVIGLAKALLDNGALHELLEGLAVLARHAVADAQAVSITVVEDDEYRTINSTGPDALAVDAAQYREGVGPCLEAIRTARQLEISVGDTADRWPHFSAVADEAGVGAVLSTPLVKGSDDVVGGLNVYARRGGSFGPGDRRSAELIGEQAAILAGFRRALMSTIELNDQLRQAVQTREVIGAAKGILMERQSCTSDQAFDILRRASQRENRKLRQVAQDLVSRVEARAAGFGFQQVTIPRYAVLEAARTQAGMSLDELWIAYFALGGTAQPDGIREYLSGQGLPLPDNDVLAQAINERFLDRGENHPVPYGADPD